MWQRIYETSVDIPPFSTDDSCILKHILEVSDPYVFFIEPDREPKIGDPDQRWKHKIPLGKTDARITVEIDEVFGYKSE